MDVEQALREVEAQLKQERDLAGNPGAWKALLTRELTNALRDTYGVPGHIATANVLREIQEASDPIDVLEDLVIRHRIVVLCGDVEKVKAELQRSGAIAEA